MNYAFKMIAFVLALGVLVLQGCKPNSYRTNFIISNSLMNDVRKINDKSYNKNLTTPIVRYQTPVADYSDYVICLRSNWKEDNFQYKREAKQRGLNCEMKDNKTAASSKPKTKASDEDVYKMKNVSNFWMNETIIRGLDCDVKDKKTIRASNSKKEIQSKSTIINVRTISDSNICSSATYGKKLSDRWVRFWHQRSLSLKYVNEAKRRGLNCEVNENTTVITSKTKVNKPSISSAELEAERQKRIELERKLVALQSKQKQEQQRIDTDTRVPLIEIISIKTKGKRGTITGIARDNVQVAEVTVDGKPVSLSNNGDFQYSTFVPSDGITLNVQVTDVAGLTSSKTVSLQRNDSFASTAISFDRLNPLGKRVKTNSNALALIVGVEGYENTNADALYADRDAKMFRDYASEKLGIPENRIKTLLNDNAEYAEILLTTKDWLRRASKSNKSDIYIYFAGHGLASDDGKDMYLLPYDGRPRLLDKTALLRDELFAEIQQANPKSVTVFLDTCYSGTTRGTDMLIASRPIAIRALEQSIPNNFTVFSAAAGDQTSKPLEEAKHGMFSYFLMKGMEGDADSNNDNKITARELHAYVEQNVVQQSSGSQTPELQGDKDRVLVQFN